ncbi:MAG: undecaprenyl/decaprenyl-phosphate alpha-N-acetylglucosaminyl 1-phosphate transferase [Clostridia bacterium]|nr:undecaprenyl/decaprenyl-phosphate alpha-N-acetylglucosaminyl 1-phosphate transferase [Clostridia bacterium]
MSTTEIIFLILTFVVAFAFSFAATPIAHRLAFKIGAVDVPKDSRRMHKKPIPRLGGVAIVFGFMVAICCFGRMNRELTAILVGAAIIFALGIVDDCKNLDAKFKFLIQILAALVVMIGGNIRITVFTNPNIFSDNPYLVLPWWLSGIATIVWIVFITNAVNFIDGLDGLAAGVSAIMSVSLVFISIRVGEYWVAVVGLALMGACFGFLPFNFNPAKIFMGDSGSTFLGFILASLSVQGVFKSYAIISFAVPLLILGLPLFDAMFAMIRRVYHGQSPMKADRGHLHHRLIDMGFSQKQTVFILYAISGILGITAVLLAEYGSMRALVLMIAVLIFIVVVGRLPKITSSQEQEEEKTQEEE